MRQPTEIQNRIVERILDELGKSGIRVFENVIGLVEGSPTDDVYRYIRAEKRFEIYVYENGECDVSGPLRNRVFELPDFESLKDLEESVVEDITFQARPETGSDARYQKLRSRGEGSRRQLVAFLVVLVLGSLILWIRSRP